MKTEQPNPLIKLPGSNWWRANDIKQIRVSGKTIYFCYEGGNHTFDAIDNVTAIGIADDIAKQINAYIAP